jgi:hypothetical protein
VRSTTIDSQVILLGALLGGGGLAVRGEMRGRLGHGPNRCEMLALASHSLSDEDEAEAAVPSSVLATFLTTCTHT